MYAEDVFVWAIGIGGASGLATAVVTAVLMWRHGGNSIGEIAKYTTSAFLTPACIVLAIGGWLHGKLPPGQFSITGVADQSITSAAAFDSGEHCLAGPADDRHHPGIRAHFELYARKYNSRNRLKIESEEMGQLIKDGDMAGLHVYSILYNYRETSSLEQRGVKVKSKDYWGRSTDFFCRSEIDKPQPHRPVWRVTSPGTASFYTR